MPCFTRIIGIIIALALAMNVPACVQDRFRMENNPWDALPDLKKENRDERLGWARRPVELGADPNGLDASRRTPLMIAAAFGSEKLIRDLVSAGADIRLGDQSGNTPLTYAAAYGSTAGITTLVSLGADIKSANRDQQTPLHVAAGSVSANAESVRTLIELGSDIASLDYIQMSPLARAAGYARDPERLGILIEHNGDDHAPAASQSRLNNALTWASLGKDVAAIDAMVAAGAMITSADPIWGTPLHAAAHSGDAATITALLWHGAERESTSHPEGATPLSVAVNWGSAETARALLEAGADVNAVDAFGRTALMRVATTIIQGEHGAIQNRDDVHQRLELLIDAGANVDATDKHGWTALILAMDRAGDQYTIDRLIKAGANVNAAGHDGVTVLMVAAAHRPTDIVKSLIDAGANVRAVDAHQCTALMWAARSETWSRTDLLQALIKAGTDIEARDERGWTALAHAAEGLRVDSVAALLQLGADSSILKWNALHIAGATRDAAGVYAGLKAGADPNARDIWGRTPLIWAARVIQGRLLFDPLIKAGTDIEAVDSDGRTALIHAARTAYTEEVKALLDAGANINAADRDGMTPLMHAVARQAGRFIAELLIQRGAKIDARDGQGRTALMHCLDYPNGELKTAEMLLAAGADVVATDSLGASVLDRARNSPNGIMRKQLVDLIQVAATKPAP